MNGPLVTLVLEYHFKSLTELFSNEFFDFQACTKSPLKLLRRSKVPTKTVITKKMRNGLKSAIQVHCTADLQRHRIQILALQVIKPSLSLCQMGRPAHHQSHPSLCHRQTRHHQQHRRRNLLKRLPRPKTLTWCQVRRRDLHTIWTRTNSSHQVRNILLISFTTTHILHTTILWTQWIHRLTLTRRKCLGGWTTIVTTLHPLYGEFLFIYF